MSEIKREYVIILDAGSQFGKVIDRKVRQLCVETKILPLCTEALTKHDDAQLKGIIISGGPNSVNDPNAPSFDEKIFSMGVPVLGICYGMQLLAKSFGGKVGKTHVREDGQDEVDINTGSRLFAGLSSKETVLLTHGDSIVDSGPNLKIIGRSSADIIAAVEHVSLPLFGVQFHPEVELTENGIAILKNFLEVCNCSFNFVMEDRETTALREISWQARDAEKVVCLASGGVDSTVCALLLLKALGPERVVCIHIDHGFMRENESNSVTKALEGCGLKVHVIRAADQFANATTKMPARKDRPEYTTKALCETIDPEEKRTIIGNMFMTVCDSVFETLQLDPKKVLLGQGTLRPDLIESGSAYASKQADAIKTHHNDTAVVRQLRRDGRIIEPLCDYHKDEVRELGMRLGLAPTIVYRQPFPGPGLAIRILCNDGHTTNTTLLGDSEETVKNILKGVVENHLVSPSLLAKMKEMSLEALVLPIRTVGVQGDGRTYANAVAVYQRNITQMATKEEWNTVLKLAKIIPKVAQTINRVIYMFPENLTKFYTQTSSKTLNSSSTSEESTHSDTRVNDELNTHSQAENNVTKLCADDMFSLLHITPTYLTPDVIDKARLVDHVVNTIFLKHDLSRRVSQVAVVLIPITFRPNCTHSVVIRTLITNDFMTGVPAAPGSTSMPLNVLEEIVISLQQVPFLSHVFYDLTAKPPGTTEWEESVVVTSFQEQQRQQQQHLKKKMQPIK